MNRQHLSAILWLRWRMSYNQWRRGGVINAILMVAIVWFVIVGSVAMFFAALIGGIIGLIGIVRFGVLHRRLHKKRTNP